MDDQEDEEDKELEKSELGLDMQEERRDQAEKTNLRKIILKWMGEQKSKKKELQIFQEHFAENYSEKVYDVLLPLKMFGISHVIFYDSNKFIIAKPAEDYNPKTGRCRVYLETEKFFYNKPEEIHAVLEQKYINEAKDVFGFRRVFVLEEPENLEPDKIMSDCYGNVYLPLDQAAMEPGFISMRIGEPIGIRVGDEEEETCLEGRILEILCNYRNKIPC